LLSLILTVAAALGGLLWGLTGNFDIGLVLFLRLALVGVILAWTASFCRWLCKGTAERLATLRSSRGDFGAVGLLLGIVLAGALTARPESSQAAMDEGGPKIGERMEITGPTLEGKTFRLEDYREKVVLIDFWATWCPPCVAELPNLKAVYERHHADGLELVSVSLDQEPDVLKRFLLKAPLPWPQIFFDEPDKRGWDNPLAVRYGVRAIPSLMLVDGEGKLQAVGLRGPMIEQTVAAALGTPPTWYERLLEWLFRGIFGSPWWVLLLTCWGGALVFVFLEMGLRRALGRRTAGVA
jgi:thiol-disulfide isomerase/thioredoxin